MDDAASVPPVIPPPAAEDAGEDPGTGAQVPPIVPPPASLEETGEFGFDDWTLPPEKPRSKALWLIPIVLLVGVGVIWAMVFLDASPTTTSTIAAAETTTTAGPATTTTQATTTTSTQSTSTTTSTLPFPPPSSWDPVGDPIDTADLTLKAAGIGPLAFGSEIEDVAGRLTSSLGQATLAGVDGLCGPEEGYWLQWGELQATFDGFETSSVFVSYRYEDVGLETSLGLVTLSGLALGDTVADLKAIYAQFTITFEVIDGRDHFRLVDGSELLLWGPVSSVDDDGLVEGIYSPSPCDAR